MTRYIWVWVAIVSLGWLTAFASAGLSSPTQAVDDAVHGKEGVTDIDGDGLHVLPVKVERADGMITITGRVLHTWRGKPATPVDYTVTVENGKVSGTISVTKVDNPDGAAIGHSRSGKLSGTVKAVSCDILMDQRPMRGTVKLIQMVVQQVTAT